MYTNTQVQGVRKRPEERSQRLSLRDPLPRTLRRTVLPRGLYDCVDQI